MMLSFEIHTPTSSTTTTSTTTTTTTNPPVRLKNNDEKFDGLSKVLE